MNQVADKMDPEQTGPQIFNAILNDSKSHQGLNEFEQPEVFIDGSEDNIDLD